MDREYIESELKKGFEGLKKFIKSGKRIDKYIKKYNRKEKIANMQKRIKELEVFLSAYSDI